jgi:hypothetical protein
MGHLHHKAFPILREIVTGLPDFSIEQQGYVEDARLESMPTLLSQAASIGLKNF